MSARGVQSNPVTQGQAPGGVLGVVSKSKATSLRIYNNHDKYNEWVFIATQMSVAAGGRPERRSRGAAVVSHSARDPRAADSAADLRAPADLVNPRGAQVLIAPPAPDPEWVSLFVPATGAPNTHRLKPALYNASMIASCNAGLTRVIALLSGVGCTRLVNSAT